MEEKNSIKISLSTFLLFIAIIVIILLVLFMLFNQNAHNKEIATLQNNVSALQKNIDNSSSQNYQNIQNQAITSSVDTESLSEKQTIEYSGITVTLYTNNQVEVSINSEESNGLFGDNVIEGVRKVSGLSGNIEKMLLAHFGSGVDPYIFLLMKDGTVNYFSIFDQMRSSNSKYTLPDTFKLKEKIGNVSNAIDIKVNDNGVVIAITEDGKEVKIFNENGI